MKLTESTNTCCTSDMVACRIKVKKPNESLIGQCEHLCYSKQLSYIVIQNGLLLNK